MRLLYSTLIVCLFSSSVIWAQYKGCLRGAVYQSGGKTSIAEASVEILHQSPRKAEITDAEGRFLIGNIAPGSYQLRVEAEGYNPSEQTITIRQDTLTLQLELNLPDNVVSSQTVRGNIQDAASGAPLVQAQIELMNFSPLKSAFTDEEGYFRLEGVPVGRQRFRVTKNGYQEYIVREAIVSAGKELVLEIPLEEIAEEVKSNANPDGGNNSTVSIQRMRIVNTRMLPSNQMTLGNVFPFTIEDVQRYAGCLNDPARAIAASLPSAFNTDDTQNFIISRGNTPYGNAWFIEGIPFENPNHFGTMGNTGGPFQILNTNALSNSDYLISAAPAEYGGATAGIFDFHVNEGNNQRFEFTAQFSMLGGEVVAEGPFKKGRSSFLVAYRYSLLHIIQRLGVDITSGAAPQYQDLTFKLNFDTKKGGTVSVFGVGGLGNVDLLHKDIEVDDLFSERERNLYVRSKMGLIGVKHQVFLNRNTFLRTTVFGVHQNYQSHRDSLTVDYSTNTILDSDSLYQVRNIRTNTGLHLLVQSKINAQYSLRAGIRVNAHFLDIHDHFLHKNFVEFYSKDFLLENQVFFENLFKLSDKFVLSAGVHGYYFTLNKRSWAVEPRVAMNWYVGRHHTLSLSYGWHSKYPSFTMLFFVKQNEGDAFGNWDNSNRDLALMRSHHVNLSYNVQLAHEWRVLAEVYGQYHTNVPVESLPSSFSLLNYGEHPIYPKLTGLESTGLGYNYGAELTLQKFFGQGYYATVCGSYFRSFYRGSDLVWRNTAFDARYLVQIMAGKEFKIGRRKNNVLTVDLRFHHHGGRPYTPIDIQASMLAGKEVLQTDLAYSQRVKPYSRIDFKFGARFNHRKKRISHYFYVDLINVGMFDNELKKQFNPNWQQPDNPIILTSSQFGLVPNLFYRLNF